MREYPPVPRTYELMTILSPEVPEEDIVPSLETIAGYIRNEAGVLFEVLRDAPWGRRRLAYPIRYHGRDVRDGYYTVFHFEAGPAAVTNIDRELKLNERILRHIIVKYELAEGQPRPEEIKEGDLLRTAAPPAPAEPAPAPPAEAEAAAAAEETEPTAAPAETVTTDETLAEAAPVEETATGVEPGEGAEAAPTEASAPVEETATEAELGEVTEAAPTEVSAPVQETVTGVEPGEVTDSAPTEASAPVEVAEAAPTDASAGPAEAEAAPEETKEG